MRSFNIELVSAPQSQNGSKFGLVGPRIAGAIRLFPPTIVVATLFACLLTIWATGVPALRAATVVVTNQTKQTVAFAVANGQEGWRRLVLKPQELVPIPVAGRTPCRLLDDQQQRRYELLADSVYSVESTGQGALELRHWPLSLASSASNDFTDPDWKDAGRVGTLSVKVMVDDDEVRKAEIWQSKLRRRFQAASQVLEYYCRLRLRIVGFDTWTSNDELISFSDSAAAFTPDTAAPAETDAADVIMGFTSQHVLSRDWQHDGAARMPLDHRILIREGGARVSEAEKLEILLHELGHFLGAAHSRESSSIMRPVLGGGKVNSRSFRLAYDPVNVLAMNIVSEQWRRGARRVDQFTPLAQSRLAGIYVALAGLFPDDPTALRLATHVTASPEYGALAVAEAILRVAALNRRRPSSGSEPYADDNLMSLYVRAAAASAKKLPKEHAPKAFLLGLAMTLDRENILSRLSSVARRYQSAESAAVRRRRLALVGRPTMRGRVDLMQHFLASSVLAIRTGARGAETAGFIKEMHDAAGRSGFSFADMAANLAGIQFALELRQGEVTLEQLEETFLVASFMPSVEGLAEGLTIAELQNQFGNADDDRFRNAMEEIRLRVRQLPGYRRLPFP